jgi:hypothetical protein
MQRESGSMQRVSHQLSSPPGTMSERWCAPRTRFAKPAFRLECREEGIEKEQP